ncbi:hypothetical protein HRI_002691000 [Hibiscus trionum]|uniref:Uncharacterized protein n=1 Tax=Hibiscus trionum TaxID=183268 RepID=A0A9W7I7F9_HIBTR|nr:hypothetical protein HRI_002691000 [Hibiscus trionum]
MFTKILPPSPLSVSFHTGVQSGSGSTCTDELVVCKRQRSPTIPISKVQPPKPANTKGPITATATMPSVLPQARIASLARFLEKIKGRVAIGLPYEVSKKSVQCTTLESNACNIEYG